ncbi:FxsB family cyclophane-forming radical SAM/SPASM peptide maturase [Embleya sp. NPDC059259]|uniref:FxsB family cyclophane-forming radical SAM/SPASM peptide maturase n=1 Tax=unclassified Embleya TaxID=2699296 RepID=UPI0036930E1C
MNTSRYLPTESGAGNDRLRKPLPFNEFILKIHSRCNLACDYCYMYEMADQSWRAQPGTMSVETVESTCRSISEHIATHAIPAVGVVLHGGEPLLVGHRTLNAIAMKLHEHLAPLAEVRLGIQTNGVLLDEEFLRILRRWHIKVGVSVDGRAADHDRHRKYRNGKGSYVDVESGLEILRRPEHRSLFSGILSVIDVAHDPVGTYLSLASFDPPAIDFLLPHGNWSGPPPARGDDPQLTPYADWLISVFDVWYGAEGAPRIRLFADIIETMLGGEVASETVGLAPVRLAVVETDGSIEQVDALKSTFPGATELGLRARRDPLSEALRHPAIVARQTGVDALSPVCRKCPIGLVCGGGQYTHRFKEGSGGSGFLNPSVYCPDLLKLISHILRRVGSELSPWVVPGDS